MSRISIGCCVQELFYSHLTLCSPF